MRSILVFNRKYVLLMYIPASFFVGQTTNGGIWMLYHTTSVRWFNVFGHLSWIFTFSWTLTFFQRDTLRQLFDIYLPLIHSASFYIIPLTNNALAKRHIAKLRLSGLLSSFRSEHYIKKNTSLFLFSHISNNQSKAVPLKTPDTLFQVHHPSLWAQKPELNITIIQPGYTPWQENLHNQHSWALSSDWSWRLKGSGLLEQIMTYKLIRISFGKVIVYIQVSLGNRVFTWF